MYLYPVGNGLFQRYSDKKCYTAAQIQTLRKAGFIINVSFYYGRIDGEWK